MAHRRRLAGLQKIRWTVANHLCGTVRCEKHRGIFFYSDSPNTICPAVLQYARREHHESAHPMALDEVCVGDGAP